jgi:copper resistance protein D
MLTESLRIALKLAGVFASCSAIFAVPIQTALIEGDWTAIDSGRAVAAVLTYTDVGKFTLLHAIVCLTMAAALFLGRERAALVLSGLAIASLASTGHASQSLAHMVVDAVHVLSACAWMGALVPFAFLLCMSADPGRARDAIASMRRFSVLGHAAVALTLISGLANTILTLCGLPANRSSPYQLELIVKVFAAFSMTGIAMVNRYLVVPRLKVDPITSRYWLLIGTSVEVVLGLVAIVLVASFGLQDPS